MTKKICIVFFFLCCTILVVAQKIMVDGIAYQVIENTNTVKVVRALNPYEGSIFIPSTIAYN